MVILLYILELQFAETDPCFIHVPKANPPKGDNNVAGQCRWLFNRKAKNFTMLVTIRKVEKKIAVVEEITNTC